MKIETKTLTKALAKTLAAASLLLAMACSGHGPTEAPGGDVLSLTAQFRTVSGNATIVDAQLILDKVVVADSCPPADQSPVLDNDNNVTGYDCLAPAVPAVSFTVGGGIGTGGHTLEFLLSQLRQGAVEPYTVPAFNVVIRNGAGAVVKTVALPAQTVPLGPGAGGGPRTILFRFSV